jgi:AmmeMemoRadiSam system protein B
MAAALAPLRTDLDAMPSPDPEQPGILLRDAAGYSSRALIIPPQLIRTLSFFDGQSTEDDLREFLVRSSGSFDVSEQLRNLVDTLAQSGFLVDENFRALQEKAHAEFAALEVKPPSFAGLAYPECPEDCRRFFDSFLEGAEDKPLASTGRVLGIAAPHASFEGGPEVYRDAFHALRSLGSREEMAGKTFVLLATSHYGEPGKFGVTRKPFLTPYGTTTPANELLDELAASAPDALVMEDFCHIREHSAEFHVVWLQHLFGAKVKVLPVLVGAFAKSIYLDQQPPENEPQVASFFRALRSLDAKYGDELVWVLSIDMAHMGPRYGDQSAFAPESMESASTEAKDRLRLEALQSGNAQQFWADVLHQQDPLKWCGSSCLYTLLQLFPGMKTEALNYGQWHIDEESLVTFGALRFSEAPRIVLS